jgi:hypothetical protein
VTKTELETRLHVGTITAVSAGFTGRCCRCIDPPTSHARLARYENQWPESVMDEGNAEALLPTPIRLLRYLP